MRQHEASRTLVKSPPELWAECSDAAALARHLGGFGEIRITRLDPETAVAWEGEQVRGTVRIEPAGWGTKVILTAEQAVKDAAPTETPTSIETHAPPEAPAPTETPVSLETPGPVEESLSAEEPLPVEDPIGGEAAIDSSEPSARLHESAPARRRRFARLRAFLRGPEPGEPVPGTVEPVPNPAQPVPNTAESVVSAAEVPADAAPIQPEPTSIVEPEPAPTAEPAPDPSATQVPDAEAALAAALDSLGQAHHRPYSRA
ncbi:MAG TPA: hypothetical protein VME22_07930 [Solirubrobacteraceae bacterium]|nr:hypothetical protein [Solirubrobacteraceae bacterium]